MAWRAVPVKPKGQRQPTGLWAQFFLAHIMCPAAATLANTTTHDEHIHNAAVGHIHVVPMVDRRTENHHGTPPGLVGRIGKLACNLNDLFTLDPGNRLLPCGCVGNIIIKTLRNLVIIQATVQAIIGQHQVMHGYGLHSAAGKLQGFNRHLAVQYAVVVAVRKDRLVVLLVSEVWESHG